MYKVKKRIEVAGAHCLKLDYESQCKNLHGHNWIIDVEVSGEVLNPMGMLIDFTHIKKVVMKLDHANINDVVGNTNPTAENLAKWIANEVNGAILFEAKNRDPDFDGADYELLPVCSMVSVQESEGNIACYTP